MLKFTTNIPNTEKKISTSVRLKMLKLTASKAPEPPERRGAKGTAPEAPQERRQGEAPEEAPEAPQERRQGEAPDEAQ